MLNPPAAVLGDEPAGKRPTTMREIAGQAANDVV
jgi:hypothetical protein